MKRGMMRKTGLLVVILCALSLTGFSQVIQGALIFGGNLTQVDGDEVYGFNNIGFNTGAAAIVPFGKKWSMSIEALYSQKGAHRKAKWKVDDPSNTVDGSYDYNLNYAEIPVLVHFNDKDVMTFGAGFSYGRLVNYDETDNRIDEFNTVEYESEPSIHDVEFLADIRFRVYKNLKMNFRYAYSLAPFREVDFHWDDVDHPEHRKQYNNVITWRMIWVINEKQSRRTQKDTEIYNDLR